MINNAELLARSVNNEAIVGVELNLVIESSEISRIALLISKQFIRDLSVGGVRIHKIGDDIVVTGLGRSYQLSPGWLEEAFEHYSDTHLVGMRVFITSLSEFRDEAFRHLIQLSRFPLGNEPGHELVEVSKIGLSIARLMSRSLTIRKWKFEGEDE